MYSRVTTAGMYKTLLGSLQGNLGNLQDLQRQMSTWNKYSKLSDNPSAISRSLEIKSALDANEKYQENSENAVTMLKYSHGALNTALSAAEKIRELTIQAGDAALTTSELEDITDQIKAEKQAIIDALNTKVAGQYIFGGTDTSTPPFTVQSDGSVRYNGADERIQYALADGLLGDVSFAGSEIVPTNESSYFICSHKVDMDWKWTGREEKVQITVGNRTLPVYIPEHWIDEVATDKTKSTDYNRFRDPGEVTGISLDDIALLVNRALEEQGADMLVSAYVDKNYNTNEQQLILKSLSGEKIGITGWTDTDYMPVPQTLSGLQFDKDSNGDAVLPDWGENVLGGNSDINLGNLTGKSLTLMSGGKTATIDFSNLNISNTDDLKAELENQSASQNLDLEFSIQDNKLVITSSNGDEIRASGSALTDLLGTANQSEKPEYNALMGNVNVTSWRDDRMGKGINITLTDSAGNVLSNKNFNFSDCSSISDLIENINSTMPVSAGDDPFASTVNGRLVLKSTQGAISVNGSGAEQLFGDANIESSKSSLAVQVGDASPIRIYINADDDIDAIADKINSIEGVYSRASADNDQLVIVAQRTGALDNSLTVNENQESLHYPKLTLEAEGAAKKLFDFNFEVTDPSSGIQVGRLASVQEKRAVDHSHMDVFDVLGMETGMKSVEFGLDEKLTLSDGDLHWRIISGGHTADITLNSGESYSMTEIADRLKNAGAGWLNVTVDVFNPGGTNQDAAENGIGTSYNSEAATQRLVIEGLNGEQVIFLDMNQQHYADKLGLSTGLRAEPGMGTKCINFPSAPCVDDKIGVRMRVQMNCGMSYDVDIKRPDVINPETGFVDRVKVMQQIVDQVNAQEGENIMGLSRPVNAAGAALDDYASIYFLSGESFTVVDLPFSDPEWNDYSGGIAAQMGIHGGVTANLAKTDSPKKDSDTIGVTGTIKFANLAHEVEIDVGENDTVKSVMDRLRSQAGDWLYVNYYDTHMGQMDGSGQLGGRNSGDYPIIAISSVDGSAVGIVDMKGSIAQDILGLSTGVQGDADLSSWTIAEGATPGQILTLNVAGYEHKIDMTAMLDANTNGVIDAYDLAETINARMQDYDLKAEINKDNKLVIWSPRGYSFSVSMSEVDADGTKKATNLSAADVGLSTRSVPERAAYDISIETGTSSVDNVSTSGDGWNFENGVLNITADGTYNIVGTGAATQNKILLAQGVKATIFLENVNIDLHDTDAYDYEVAFNAEGAELDLWLFGDNTLISGYDVAGLQTHKINGMGSVTISSESGDGSIDGTLTAECRFGCGAGIGGACQSSGCPYKGYSVGDIIIRGGTINAKASNGAGIGGGAYYSDVDVDAHVNVIIAGGDVTAESTSKGAGIGSGDCSSDDGSTIANNGVDSITIIGGTVKASANAGGNQGAAIGGGYSGNSGIIRINSNVDLTTVGFIDTENGATESIGRGKDGVVNDYDVVEIIEGVNDLTSSFLGTAQAETYYRGGYKLDSDASTRKAPGIHGQNATIRSGANTTKQNGFAMIDDLVAAVKAGNRDTLGDVMLPRIDNFIDNLLSVMSSNGALQNRYNTNTERLTKDNVVMTDSYDKLVKVDPADVATQMMMASYMYQANLSVISQLIQPSLLDFLH